MLGRTCRTVYVLGKAVLDPDQTPTMQRSIRDVLALCAGWGAVVRRPTRSLVLVWYGLLVIADAATEIVDLGYVAYLRNGRRVGARLWKHVADLSDLAFLRRSVKVRPV